MKNKLSRYSKNRAAQQWTVVLKEAHRCGVYQIPKFDDPVTSLLMENRFNYASICGASEGELKWFRKEFIQAYRSAMESERENVLELNGVNGEVKKLASNILSSI